MSVNEFLLIRGDSDGDLSMEPNGEPISNVKISVADNRRFLTLSNKSSLSGNDMLRPIAFALNDFFRKLVWGLEPNG